MSTRGFLIKILLHRCNAEHTKIISAFLFTYITHKLKENLVRTFTVPGTFLNFFTIMMSRLQKLLIQSHLESIHSTHSVLRNKNNLFF